MNSLTRGWGWVSGIVSCGEGEGPRPRRRVMMRCQTQQALHSGREIALQRVWKS